MIRRPPRSTRVRSSAASDVYKRQLRQLVKKGIACQSLSKPAVYAAMPLEDALDAALRQKTRELRYKEDVKQELIRLAPRLSPVPLEEYCSYRVVTGCN